MRNTRIWDSRWAFRPEVPALNVEGMAIEGCRYGLYQPSGDHQTYRGLTIRRTFVAGSKPSPSPSGDVRPARDETPPNTVVTFVGAPIGGKRRIRGTSADDGPVRRVLVNGSEALPIAPGCSEWEVLIDDPPDGLLSAQAEDSSGNVEPHPHRMRIASSVAVIAP
jgi:hypothetical protein